MLFRENADYRTGTTARVEYQDALTFTYDKVGQLVREASARGDYQHHYDVLGNITRTELPHQRAFEYLYYGSGHLQQTQWRDNAQLTVLAEYQRDRLHRETLRTSGALDNETGYDCRGRITHQVARQMNTSISRGNNSYQTRIDPTIPGRPDPKYSVDSHTFTSGDITSKGGIRNTQQFWEQWSQLRPNSLSVQVISI